MAGPTARAATHSGGPHDRPTHRMSEYERRPDGSILRRYRLGEDYLFFHASDVRKEKTGIHGTITVSLNSTILAFDTFNVGRSEERGRLANAAHKMLPALLAESHQAAVMRHDLDIFAHGLWRHVCSEIRAEETQGNGHSPAASFWLPPYCASEMGTVLFGPPGAGKSWLAMVMAVSLRYGIPALWPTAPGCRPLFINLERSRSSVASRLAMVNRALGLEADMPLLCFHARGRMLSDILEQIRETVRDERVDYVFLDSITRGGFGDLNENLVGNRWIDALNGLGVGWLAIGHSARADDTHLYGSVMGDAGADFMVRLVSEQGKGGELGVMLQMTKANHTRKAKPEVLALAFSEDGLESVRRSQAVEFPGMGGPMGMTMHERIVAYLETTEEATATELARELGYQRQNVSSWLNGNLAFVRGTKAGKEQPWRLAPQVATRT